MLHEFALVVPVKPPVVGKSRLTGIDDEQRRALAQAFALDTSPSASTSGPPGCWCRRTTRRSPPAARRSAARPCRTATPTTSTPRCARPRPRRSVAGRTPHRWRCAPTCRRWRRTTCARPSAWCLRARRRSSATPRDGYDALHRVVRPLRAAVRRRVAPGAPGRRGDRDRRGAADAAPRRRRPRRPARGDRARRRGARRVASPTWWPSSEMATGRLPEETARRNAWFSASSRPSSRPSWPVPSWPPPSSSRTSWLRSSWRVPSWPPSWRSTSWPLPSSPPTSWLRSSWRVPSWPPSWRSSSWPAAFFAVDFLAAVFLAAAFLAGAFFAVFFAAFLAVFFAADAAFLAGAVAFLAVGDAAATRQLGSFLAPDTTSLSSAPAVNFGTAFFFALMRSPVCGLRTIRASRTRFSKEPKPVIATFSPWRPRA